MAVKFETYSYYTALTSHFESFWSIVQGTLWKFHDFSQILREINFGDSRGAESAILTHLETLNFNF